MEKKGVYMNRYLRLLHAPIIVILCWSEALVAEIVDSTPHGFSLTNKIEVSVSPQAAYTHIVSDIALWWDPAHTFSGDSGNLTLVDQPNGCFCETLPSGGVRHGTVVYAAPGKHLRLTGGLGPLQAMAVVGTMTYNLDRNEETTTVTMEYRVAGYHPGGLDKLAPAVDAVLKGQLLRLEKHIEGSDH